jgi:hypothetical protein
LTAVLSFEPPGLGRASCGVSSITLSSCSVTLTPLNGKVLPCGVPPASQMMSGMESSGASPRSACGSRDSASAVRNRVAAAGWWPLDASCARAASIAQDV